MQYVFGAYTLDTLCYELHSAEGVIPLDRQGFTMLAYLIQHRDRVMLRHELFDYVWPDRFVSDSALEQCIAVVRRAVGDSGRAQRVIQTVRGRGYRFVAPVEECLTASPGLPAPTTPRAADVPEACSLPAPAVLPPPVGLPAPLAEASPSFVETVHGQGYRFIAPVSTREVLGAPERLEDPRYLSSPLYRHPQPFVGRKAELAQLAQEWTEACQGMRHVMIIAGEAGIGKTTLVEAFVAWARTTADVWIGHGQCIDQYGAGEPYFPLLEALGRLASGPQGEQLIAVMQQYAPSWLMQIPALLPPADRDALRPPVSTLTQGRMLRELTEALDHLTAKRPFILVLEDLHWSDAPTLAWLSYVARRRDPARLLILATYRPVETIARAHPVRTVITELKQRPQCAELVLDYLSEADVARYLTQRFGATPWPPELVRGLHQCTSGNPLFLVTVVDELDRQQRLIEGPAAWDIAGGMDALASIIPASLQALIELQLTQLDPDEQTLLEAASVAGIEFAVAALAAAVECPEDEVESQCAALAQQGQFVQTREAAVWPDGTVTGRYAFLHALHHEVLYRRIPAGRQTQWHARIGARLECAFATHAEDIAAELALHLIRGHRIPQAIPHVLQAGRSAMQRGAYQEAMRYLTLGIERLATLPATPERHQKELALYLDLTIVLRVVKGFASVDAQGALTQARALCQQVGDTQRLRQVLLGLWNLHVTRGELQTAYELAEQLSALNPRQDSRHLGYTLFYRGAFTAAWEHLERCMACTASPQALSDATDLFSRGSLNRSNVLLHAYASWCLWLLGYPDQALHKSRATLSLAVEESYPISSASALSWATQLHQLCRMNQRVYELAETSITANRELGFTQRIMQATILQGWALADQGQSAAGLQQMRQGLAAWQATGDRLHLPYNLSLLADVYGRIGQAEQGLRVLDEAFAVMETSGIRWVAAELHRTQGELLLLQRTTPRHVEEAEACFQRAIAVARQQRAKSLELRAAMRLSRLWQQQRKYHEARTLLTPIYDGFTEGFETPDLQEAQALLATLGS
jgi:DNA-binding winged helix-turn-helix (wHTH) protein/predicted ATPase